MALAAPELIIVLVILVAGEMMLYVMRFLRQLSADRHQTLSVVVMILALLSMSV